MVKKLSTFSTTATAFDAYTPELASSWNLPTQSTRAYSQIDRFIAHTRNAVRDPYLGVHIHASEATKQARNYFKPIKIKEPAPKSILTKKKLTKKTSVKSLPPAKRVQFSTETTTLSAKPKRVGGGGGAGSGRLISKASTASTESKVAATRNSPPRKFKSILKPNSMLNVPKANQKEDDHQQQQAADPLVVYGNNNKVNYSNQKANKRTVMLEELQQKYSREPKSNNDDNNKFMPKRSSYSNSPKLQPIVRKLEKNIELIDKKTKPSTIAKQNDDLWNKFKKMHKQLGIDPKMVQLSNEKTVRVVNMSSSRNMRQTGGNSLFNNDDSLPCVESNANNNNNNNNNAPTLQNNYHHHSYEVIDSSKRQEICNYCKSDVSSFPFDNQNHLKIASRVMMLLLIE